MFRSMELDLQQLVQLVQAESLAQLEGVCSAFTFLEKDEASCTHSEARTCASHSEYTDLLAKAAANIMRLHLQERSGCLLSNCSAASADTLTALWGHIKLAYRQNAIWRTSKQRQDGVDHHVCTTMTGATCELVRTLISYTQSYLEEVSSLNPSSLAVSAASRTTQQLAEQLSRVFGMHNHLLQVWVAVCLHLGEEPPGYHLLVEAAATVANLATQALPLLQEAVSISHVNDDSSGIASLIRRTTQAAAHMASILGLCFAEATCRFVSKQQKPQGVASTGAAQQHQPVLSESDSMIELVLLALALEARYLQESTVDAPAWVQAAQPKPPPSDDTTAADQGQLEQDESAWRERYKAVLQSHATLLESLRVAWLAILDEDGSCQVRFTVKNTQAAPGTAPDAELSQTESVSPAQGAVHPLGRCSSRRLVALVQALRLILRQRMELTGQMSSNTNSGSRHQAEQLQHFPSHLIMPTVRVLVEIMLLLAPHKAGLHAICLDLVMMLLTLLADEQAAQPAKMKTAEPLAKRLQNLLQLDTGTDTASVTAVGVEDWPRLPTAIAAGLLHPVVQLLSQTVMQALKSTQQQQELNIDILLLERPDGRFLLNTYGRLVVSVCQPVESKHIAAVLKSAPLVPFIVIEAATRMQACHMMPVTHQEWFSQQSDVAAAPGTSAKTETAHKPLPGRTADNTQLAAAVLLPFAWKMVHAAQYLMHNKQCLLSVLLHCRQGKQHPMTNIAALFQRFFSLGITVCKLGQSIAIQHQKQHDIIKQSDWPLTQVLLNFEDTVAAEMTKQDILQQHSAGTETIGCLGSLLGQFSAVLTGDNDRVKVNNQLPKDGSWGSCRWDVNSLEAKRLWGIAEFMMVRTMMGAVQQVCAHQQTLSKLVPSRERDHQADTLSRQLSALTLSTLADSTLSSLGNVMMMMIPISHALQSTPLWKPASDECVQPDQGSTPHNNSNSSSMHTCQQQQWQWRQAQVQQFSALQDSAEAIFRKLMDFSTEGQRYQKSSHKTSVNLRRFRSIMTEITVFCSKLQACLPCILMHFPVSFCCNNPDCINLSSLSEFQLVSSTACVCGGCKVARYCSKRCQKLHWKQHKMVCRCLQYGSM